jgi:acetoin utilization deacetylase AcuC-like enzyme
MPSRAMTIKAIPIIFSEQFLAHQTGMGHPECAERLVAIQNAVQTSRDAEHFKWQVPTALAERNPLPWLGKVHDQRYVQSVQQLAQRGGGYLDTDTVVSAQSYDVALLAVNAWLDGVDSVLQDDHPAFVLARPPGHHALRSQGMGFCLFSNAAIAAHYALEQGATRVGILDWDVHHGNGTQAIVESHRQIAYCSLHQSPCYPGTGAAHEQGEHRNVLNLPLPPGSTLDDYLPLFRQRVLPFLTQFDLDLLIVSAGYDATQADPLAGINLQPQDYGTLTHECLKLTRRILFGLEGGYALEALGQSVLSTLTACLSVSAGRALPRAHHQLHGRNPKD